MTNLEKIERFLKKITIENSAESDDKITTALNDLIIAMHEMSYRTTDDKMIQIFRNTLTSVILKSERDSLKNLCLKILNQFNQETSLQVN